MKLNDFLSKHNLTMRIERLSGLYAKPRFYPIIEQDNLTVYVMHNNVSSTLLGDGETTEEAVENLIEIIKGNRLRIKGWNSRDEYIDLKIKVPNDLTFE